MPDPQDDASAASDIREGEVATALPETFDAGLYFIGRIRTPWTRREDCPKNARESDAVCTIEVDERYAPALGGVESCTHLLVLKLDAPGAARPGAPGPAPLRAAARDLCAALAGSPPIRSQRAW